MDPIRPAYGIWMAKRPYLARKNPLHSLCGSATLARLLSAATAMEPL